MANIRNMFDFQKIADNKKLGEVVSMLENKYGVALSDDDLELATAGTGSGAVQTVERMCDKCKCTRTFRLMSGGRAVCTAPGCNNQILF